jgi:hypothetical protein
VDPYELLEAGRFAEAVREYSTLIQTEPSGPWFRGRALAYLNLRRFAPAQADLEAAEKTEQWKSVEDRQGIGVTQWLAGQWVEAAKTWLGLVTELERGRISYTDGAGGVQSPGPLWFAAVRLGNPSYLARAKRHLRTKVKSGWIENWPGPVAKFLLGSIELEELLQTVDTTPILRERELCQANFYAGVRALETGDSAQARKCFRAAAKHRPALLEWEYYLAKNEVRQRTSPIGNYEE